MKLLLCADVRLGAVCTENLGVKLSHKWQAARTEKLAELMDQAAQNNAAYVALLGRMFGRERTPESVVDSLYQAVSGEPQIQVMAFLTAGEYQRLSYRNDTPDNLHLICTQGEDSFLDEHIALRMNQGGIELQLGENDPVWLREDAGQFVLSGAGEAQVIPSFEPAGFEDAQGRRAGYAVLEWTEEALAGYRVTERQTFSFQSLELKLLPEDGQKDILQKINAAVSKIGVDTFLRVTITGRSAFGLTLNSDALKNQLQNRVFYAEVYDNTIMDIEEEAFAHDISLRSEFVRLALQDDALSESERNRIISCGWSVLNGREVSAE